MKTTDIALCKKAGKLVMGFDAVKRTMSEPKKFCGVFATSDASEKTFKELSFFASKHSKEVKRSELSSVELENVLKKNSAVFAITDKNFWNLAFPSLTSKDE